jgi:FixJ family two-component response regulator
MNSEELETLQDSRSGHARKPAPTLLIVGAVEDDAGRPSPFHGLSPRIRRLPNFARFLLQFERMRPRVVVCERDLPDGSWKDILDMTMLLDSPPPLIVASRLADDYLWAEVLNLGGYDVLTKPLDESEVHRTVRLAWEHLGGPGTHARLTPRLTEG